MRLSSLFVATISLAMLAPGVPAEAQSRQADQGRIAYMRYDPSLDVDVVMVVNPDGTGERQLSPLALECPHWSPDGRRIATCGNSDGGATAILDANTGVATLFPMPDPTLFTACYLWTPDGRRLACEGGSDDNPARNGIYTIRSSDGTHLRELVPTPNLSQVLGDFSPNGRHIVFAGFSTVDDSTGLFVASTTGHHIKQLLPAGAVAGSGGSWSPDGRHVVFSMRTTPEARQSLWVMRPNGSGLHEILVDGIACGGPLEDPDSIGCNGPAWSPDGHRIAFAVVAGDSSIYVAQADGSDPQRVSVGDGDELPDWGVGARRQ